MSINFFGVELIQNFMVNIIMYVPYLIQSSRFLSLNPLFSSYYSLFYIDACLSVVVNVSNLFLEVSNCISVGPFMVGNQHYAATRNYLCLLIIEA